MRPVWGARFRAESSAIGIESTSINGCFGRIVADSDGADVHGRIRNGKSASQLRRVYSPGTPRFGVFPVNLTAVPNFRLVRDPRGIWLPTLDAFRTLAA